MIGADESREHSASIPLGLLAFAVALVLGAMAYGG